MVSWSDIMESRLGGSYLTDMQQLRDQHKNLKEIVDFFLAKASLVYVTLPHWRGESGEVK